MVFGRRQEVNYPSLDSYQQELDIARKVFESLP